jgi:hypothetical protein
MALFVSLFGQSKLVIALATGIPLGLCWPLATFLLFRWNRVTVPATTGRARQPHKFGLVLTLLLFKSIRTDNASGIASDHVR